MTRLFYRLLLLLHPPAFRREFGGEMLWIFDESQTRCAALPLFADVFLSLARQWLLRTALWIPVGACAGASLTLATAISIGCSMRIPIHPVARTLDIAFLKLSVVAALVAISCTLILCVAWFRISRRHISHA